MPIYRIEKDNLFPVKEKSIDLEKDIQTLTEKNLKQVFGLVFVSSEFALRDFRIDTLAFNPETKSFVIIEYKRDQSFTILDQGFSYLSLLLNHKGEFVLEYNGKTNQNYKKDDIDWSQTRIIFVAQSFTNHQQNAVNFRDIPFELWEVKMFDNQTILYNQLISNLASESINKVTKNRLVQSVSKEVRVFTVEDHLVGKDPLVPVLFNNLREKIFSLGTDVKEVPKKQYIAYKASTNFVDVIVYNKELRLTLNVKSGKLNDPKKLTKDFTKPKQGHWGNGDYEIRVRTLADILYALSLIEQSYLSNK